MIPLSTLGPAASFASNVLEQFKPSRAPYLLAVSVGTLFIILSNEDSRISHIKKIMIVSPICAFILVLSILAFYFKPFKDEEFAENKSGIESDIDTQFKLARTTGIITGISCLFLIASLRAEIDFIYFTLWVLIITHCTIYLIYTIFRNIKEESINNRAYFQISFMTCLFLILLSFEGSQMQEISGSYLYDECNMKVYYTNAADVNAANENAPKYTMKPYIETPKNILQASMPCTSDRQEILNQISDQNVAIIGDDDRTFSISISFCTTIFFGILWAIYIIFWVIQLIRVWGRSTMIVGEQ